MTARRACSTRRRSPEGRRAGEYQIEARASDGRIATANVTVRDGGDAPHVVLDLTTGR